MKLFIQLVGVFVLGSVFISCEGDEAEPCTPQVSTASLILNFNPKWNGTDIEAGSEVEDHLGNRLRLFNYKSFIGEITLSNASEEFELSEVELMDFNGGQYQMTFTIPENKTYTQLEFNTGVPSEYNVDYDPSTWENSHPLSIQGAQGMHWGWNTGYIFTKFDGMADTTDAVEPTYIYPFAFHCGDDAFYTNNTFEIDLTSAPETANTIDVSVNSEFLLNSIHNIDIREDGQTHTGGDFQLAEEFTQNYNTAFSIE